MRELTVSEITHVAGGWGAPIVETAVIGGNQIQIGISGEGFSSIGVTISATFSDIGAFMQSLSNLMDTFSFTAAVSSIIDAIGGIVRGIRDFISDMFLVNPP